MNFPSPTGLYSDPNISVKKRWTEGKKVAARELQKWAKEWKTDTSFAQDPMMHHPPQQHAEVRQLFTFDHVRYCAAFEFARSVRSPP